jgi:hypothetical protein
MPKLTDTQGQILTAGAQHPRNLALPLPKGLVGAAAKMAVGKMVDCGWLLEVEANIRRGDPLWREKGEGRGTTLVVTDAGLLAVGIDPVVVQTMATIRVKAKAGSDAEPKAPSPRGGTKQAHLIEMLRLPEGATLVEITAAMQWQSHTARAVISSALRKKLGLSVTSAKEGSRGMVYRINPAV